MLRNSLANDVCIPVRVCDISCVCGICQGAASAFTALCEAVVSWRTIHNDALTMELTRIMQMYKAKLVRNPQQP